MTEGPSAEGRTGERADGRTDVDEQRTVGDLVIRIDRTLCVGFADCIKEGERAFVLDDEGVVTFLEPDSIDRDALVAACDACPVDALTVWDSSGAQIVPG